MSYYFLPYMAGATAEDERTEIKRLLSLGPALSDEDGPNYNLLPRMAGATAEEELAEMRRLIRLDPISDFILRNGQQKATAKREKEERRNMRSFKANASKLQTDLTSPKPNLQVPNQLYIKKPSPYIAASKMNRVDETETHLVSDSSEEEETTNCESDSGRYQHAIVSNASSGGSSTPGHSEIVARTTISRQVKFKNSEQNQPRRNGNVSTSSSIIVDNTTLINRFRKILSNFPYKKIFDLENMRRFKFTLQPEDSIYDHLKKAMPQRLWDHEQVFYFPGCTHSTMTGAQHLLAFGPLAQTVPNSNQIICSRFVPFYGATRELFLKKRNGLVYVGRYRMHSLMHLAPKGLRLPAYVSAENISHTAMSPGQLRGSLTHDQICDMYSAGTLRVECVALQMVDYDENIYYALRRIQMEKVPVKSQKVVQGRIGKPQKPKTGIRLRKGVLLRR